MRAVDRSDIAEPWRSQHADFRDRKARISARFHLVIKELHIDISISEQFSSDGTTSHAGSKRWPELEQEAKLKRDTFIADCMGELPERFERKLDDYLRQRNTSSLNRHLDMFKLDRYVKESVIEHTNKKIRENADLMKMLEVKQKELDDLSKTVQALKTNINDNAKKAMHPEVLAEVSKLMAFAPGQEEYFSLMLKNFENSTIYPQFWPGR